MKYKVNDEIKIKLWSVMVSEYSLDGYGNIECYGAFLKIMKELCGKSFKIKSIGKDYYDIEGSNFVITEDMIDEGAIKC